MDQPLSHRNTLSSILKVYPHDEHRCLGYTLSNRRRCMNPTNATSRATASSLLERGTRMLERAESIDSLLECLAPMVLCRRYHQNQARALASRWKEKVNSHMREQEAQHEAESQAETEDEAEEEHGELNLGIVPPPDATWRGSIIPGFRTSSGHVTWSDVFEGNDDIQTQPQTENVEERRESNTETISTREESQQEDSRVEAPSRTHTISVSIRRPERKGITRRPIEGDCGICILPLLEETAQSAGDTGQVGDDDDDDEDYESDTGDESDSASSVATVSIDESEDLVWCKARCGINYHRHCLKTWIDTFRGKPGHRPTCPTCRSVWRR